MKFYQLLSYAAALVLPQGALADNTNTGYSFATELEAVQAAVNLYNPLSIREDLEYIGVIIKHTEGYSFTASAGRKSSDRVSIRIDRETWGMVVALWHTHGGVNSRYRYFSDTDTKASDQLNLPFYLADYTGYLKVYHPGDTTLSPYVASRLGLSFHRGYAIGTVVKDKYDRPVRVRTRT